MDIQEMLDSFGDSCDIGHSNGQTITLQWSLKGVGFGMCHFYYKDNKLFCDNEGMSKDTIKKLLCLMVDNSEFTET